MIRLSSLGTGANKSVAKCRLCSSAELHCLLKL
jgi:hypothetical protein